MVQFGEPGKELIQKITTMMDRERQRRGTIVEPYTQTDTKKVTMIQYRPNGRKDYAAFMHSEQHGADTSTDIRGNFFVSS